MLRQGSRFLLSRASAASMRCSRPFSTDLPAETAGDSKFVEAWKKVMPNMDPPKTPSAYMAPRPPTPSTIPSKLTVNFVLPYNSVLSGKEVRSHILATLEISFLFLLPVVLFSGGLDSFYQFSCEMDLLLYEGLMKNWCSWFDLSLAACVSRKKDFEYVWWVRSNWEEMQRYKVDMVIIPATTGQMGVLPGHVPTIAELKPGILSVHEGNDVTKYFVSGGFTIIHANSVADIAVVEATPVDQIEPNLVQTGLAIYQHKLNSATTELEKAEAQIGVDVHSALNAALTG
ncbi:ATP synthase delta chain [Striga asiatica]|uniref:ATP synthase delta chain n=1 Tax=Striga asiatica TaxID=4170 RepID=A0A5A7R286_STRAF|nr:ATP synthase delta chain [Striga asiatica]